MSHVSPGANEVGRVQWKYLKSASLPSSGPLCPCYAPLLQKQCGGHDSFRACLCLTLLYLGFLIVTCPCKLYLLGMAFLIIQNNIQKIRFKWTKKTDGLSIKMRKDFLSGERYNWRRLEHRQPAASSLSVLTRLIFTTLCMSSGLQNRKQRHREVT